MKNLFLTIGIALTAFGLQANAQETNPEKWDYPTKPGSEEWKSFNSVTEMRAACQIPNEVLTQMNTKELLELCLNYPMINDIAFFNSPEVGYSFYFNNFNGIQEFVKREDCINALIERYKAEKSTSITSNDKILPITKIIELILNENNLYDRGTAEEKKEIDTITNSEKATRTLAPENTNSTKTVPATDVIRYFYVYTPKGTAITAMIKKEANDYSNTINDNFVKDNYPNEICLARSSNKYNCHSYALHMMDGHSKDTCWIGRKDMHDEMPYFTDGSYIEVFEGTSPRIVHYSTSEHTAIATETPGIFISKWSSLPLMKHSKESCMYYKNDDDLKYYIKSSLFSINGSSSISSGNSSTYSLPYETKNPQWTVSSNLSIKSGQGTSAITIEAKSAGEGTISAYQGNNLIATKKIQIYGITSENINVQFGINNTLYSYHSNRNECIATYSGDVDILEYDWESTDWNVSPITSDKSKVYLIAKNPPIATPMSNIKVRARSADGWSQYKLFGCRVDNSTSMYNISSMNNNIKIELKEEFSPIKEENTEYILQEQTTGNTIKEGNIPYEGGSISTDNISKGLYIITLKEKNGGRIQTEKVIIK